MKANICTIDLEGATTLDHTRELLPVGYQADPWAQVEQAENFDLDSWLACMETTAAMH